MRMKKYGYFGLFVMILFMTMAFTMAENNMKLPVYLKVSVLDDYGNSVHGAEVQLYISEQDYRKEVSPVKTEYTNKNGKVTFGGLDPRVYYMLVRKDDMDNNGGAVKTDTLKAGALNRVTVVIQ